LERRGGDGSEDADGATTAQATGIAMGALELGFWYSPFFSPLNVAQFWHFNKSYFRNHSGKTYPTVD
jgi:hypothetical protein